MHCLIALKIIQYPPSINKEEMFVHSSISGIFFHETNVLAKGNNNGYIHMGQMRSQVLPRRETKEILLPYDRQKAFPKYDKKGLTSKRKYS